MNRRYYEGLNGIRGYAALLIIAYHIFVIEGFSGCSPAADATIGCGGIAVQLFLCLSGFSLMCGYGGMKTMNDVEGYYRTRLKKIFPPFLLALLCHVVISLCNQSPVSIWEIIGTASMTFGLMPQYQESLVFAGWFLGILAVYYALFPLILVCGKTKIRAAVFFAAALVLHIAYTEHYAEGVSNSHINVIVQLVYFALGVVLYQYSDLIVNLKPRTGKILYFALILLTVLSTLSVQYSGRWYELFLMISFSCIVLNQVHYRDPVFNNRLFRFFGGISYEMYLFHMVFYRILYGAGFYTAADGISDMVLRYMLKYGVTLTLTVVFSVLLRKSVSLAKKCSGRKGRCAK